MEAVSKEILFDFSEITGYDIELFITNYIKFTDVDYNAITNFYSGSSRVSPTKSFNNLDWLTENQKNIVEIFESNAESLSEYRFWVLLEYIESIGAILETANNLSKWLRTALTRDGYRQNIEVDYVAKQSQSLEDIERNVLKSSNPLETWIDTAFKNELNEEDYTSDGGFALKVNYKNNTPLSGVIIQSVVGNIDSAIKTYGRDIDKKLTIENNDLKILDYRDTIIQAVDIKTKMSKGDNPSFPEDGLDRKFILGSNVASISYPIIFRQLADLFAKDDRFKEFSITNIRREQDALFIDFQVKTRAGEVVNRSIQSI